MHLGVDFGAKMSGKTVVSFVDNNQLYIECVGNKVDADRWLTEIIAKLKPEKVYIDAPLSLPAAYYGKDGSFHFREADKQLEAMSPMFLGGLTARAMQLKKYFSQKGIMFFEVYPAAYVRNNAFIQAHYHKKEKIISKELLSIIQRLIKYPIMDLPKDYHMIDSLFAWIIGQNHIDGIAAQAGTIEEGFIFY